MSNHENSVELQKIAKEHGMTVEEFTKKSGILFNEDGSHSLDGHTEEMLTKNYTETELKDLAEQHGMSLENMQKHINYMKQHYK